MPNVIRLRRARLLLLGLGMLGAGAVLVAFLVVVRTGLTVNASKKPEWLGNSPENIRRLTAKADPDDLVFYVTGDVRLGLRTLKKLLRIASAEKPDFVVILGDFAGGRRAREHQFFVHRMAGLDLSCPVFLLPGNHDIQPTEEFRLEEFEQLYGPAQFHFTIGKNLFVFLNNAPGYYAKTGDYLRFMERVLSERAGLAERVFVFAHTPPTGLSPSVQSHKLHGGERYMELARKHHVRWVFSGDHHGYWKGERDGTTYVVCGGGGARLRGTRGRWHHAVRVAVTDGRVTDSVVAVQGCGQGLDLTERNIVVYLWPRLTGTWPAAALTGLLLLASLALLLLSGRRWWRLRARPRGQ